MKKSIFIFLAICLGITSCKKNVLPDDPDNNLTIHGHVVESCTDSTPVEGLKIIVLGDHSTSTCNANFNIGATTDKNGNFSITYDATDFCSAQQGEGRDLAYRTANGSPVSLLIGLPSMVKEKTVYTRTLYKKTLKHYAAIIRTSKAFTEKDTLWWRNTNGELQFMQGPFQDGTIIKTFTTSPGMPLFENKPGGLEFPYSFTVNGILVKEDRPVGLTQYMCGYVNEIPIYLPD